MLKLYVIQRGILLIFGIFDRYVKFKKVKKEWIVRDYFRVTILHGE